MCMTDTIIRHLQPDDRAEWLRMRLLLWPGQSEEEHLRERGEILADSASPVFVASHPNGRLGGFLEAGTHKYADGCNTSPVGYLEGWYVDPDMRRHGVGAMLVRAAEQWAHGQGCKEMASDCLLGNDESLQAHLALDYEETERIIHFRKSLEG